MVNIEYGDFYKFLASLGVTIIGATLLLTWLFLKEPFSWMNQISQANSQISPSAKVIIEQKEALLLQLLSVSRYFLIVAFVVGILFLVVGLVLWFISQREIDRGQKLQNQKIEKELQDMTPTEIVSRIAEEVEDNNDGTTASAGLPSSVIINDPSSNDQNPGRTPVNEDLRLTQANHINSLQEYIRIESVVFEKMLKCYGNEATILSNQKIGRAIFDLIIQNDQPQQTDFIFEIKYLRNPMNLVHITRNAMRQASMLAQVYSSTTSRRAIPCVFVVVSSELSQQVDFARYRQRIDDDPELGNKNINYIFINEDELINSSMNSFMALLGLEKYRDVA